MSHRGPDAADRSRDVPFTFADQVEQWEHVPIEDAGGYVNASLLLNAPDGDIIERARIAEKSRYSEEWRNWEGRWRRILGLDSTEGKHVLDFGCGFGLESLQFARRGNWVTLVDINESSTLLAKRMIGLHGFGDRVVATSVATDQAPYFNSPAGPIDVFYCNGVLHHIPYPREILLRAAELLAPGGEIRLMLYTDKAWELSTGTPAPAVDDDAAKNPNLIKFRCAFDSVGYWADWYSEDRLRYRFGDFLDVVSYDYLTRDGAYAAVVLKPKTRSPIDDKESRAKETLRHLHFRAL